MTDKIETTDAALALLGLVGKDAVTGFKGTVTSVCFDLYGCIQVALTPDAGVDGKLDQGHWFDVNRIDLSDVRRMSAPAFGRVAEHRDYGHGPAAKPQMTGPLGR